MINQLLSLIRNRALQVDQENCFSLIS